MLNKEIIARKLRTELYVTPGSSYITYISGIMEEVFKEPPYHLMQESEIERLFADWIHKLNIGTPFQYVVGCTWFMGLKFKVDPFVLIPRPETEELVELILKNEKSQPLVVADFGTGSGCIPVALKHHRPDLTVYATDISVDALTIASINATANETEIHLISHDMREQMVSDLPMLDVMVSNPPYIDWNEAELLDVTVKQFEPHLALFVPDPDPLLYYKCLADLAKQYLKTGGHLYLEIHQERAKETAAIFEAPFFSNTIIINDLSGNERFILTKRC